MQEIDIAIVKATSSRFHVVPKEKHVETLKRVLQPSSPRHVQVHLVNSLLSRLRSSKDWLTALKTLITIHRLLREADPMFFKELSMSGTPRTREKGSFLELDNFVDKNMTPGKYDFSEWVRAYGRYIEEQLVVCRSIGWTLEKERDSSPSSLRTIPPKDLLEKLPSLQRLLRRVTDCLPKGQAVSDTIVISSLSLVLKESVKIYKTVMEGIINLASSYFELDAASAARGLDMYKEGIAGSEALSQYYHAIQSIPQLAKSWVIPKLNTPSSDFIETMESYMREAPPTAQDGVMAVEAGADSTEVIVGKGVPLRKGRVYLSKQFSHVTMSDSVALVPLPVPRIADSEAQPDVQTEINLLDFDIVTLADNQIVPEKVQQVTVERKQSTESPLDLLGELDFSSVQPAVSHGTIQNPFATDPWPDASAPATSSSNNSLLVAGAFDPFSVLPGVPQYTASP